ncbi:uncharacterized protein LOC1281499 isoform X5 [Anopheles gambiae]|uniref:uncharacterized protein LOC1281499 isoform X5 n=1 Tax=Anopheles gambiae TaxID=7165 RepID=UPI002AC9BADB|nr:uncharacterized protein LOC1281499 isoform X5 [Anopheles gambiae]
MSHAERNATGGSLKSDPSRLKMYRCHKRLDLQQQHHKCKSYRRTLRPERAALEPTVESSSGSVDGDGRRWQCRRQRPVQPDPVWPLCPSSSSSASTRSNPTVGRLCPGRHISAQLFWTAVLLLCAGFCTKTGCDDTEQFQKNRKFTPTTATVDTIPARIVWAAIDHDAELPCDITAPSSQDGVKLVLWFKDSTGIPLYSLDSRSGVPISAAQHSTIANDLGQRLFFSVGATPKEARLQIRNIKTSDGGVYRCRVDYFNSPTRNYRVNLTLAVPPEEPRIFDAQGKEISTVAGPFREGHELFLSCQVSGDEPVVSVHLSNEDPSRVITRAEGENVTLKCRADARPPVTSFSWYKNNMRMSGENGETLYLTQLERESAGSYACAASNTEGETRSSSLTLKIQFAPRCKPGTEQTSVGSLNMHSLHVKCEVEADPPDGVRFSWTYNNTRNVSPVLNSRISSHGLVSTMTYLPQSDSELVTLACWAINNVGRQTVPCLIHILPAKIPDTPRNCELHNDTVLEVVCSAGSDGGLMQSFLLEVVGGVAPPAYNLDYTRGPPTEFDNEISTMNDQATLAPLFRIQEQIPQFKLHSLEPGRDYQLLVYAVNAKGKSDPPFVIDKVRVGSALVPPYVDETIISEDPTPAETSHQDKQKQQSQMVMFAAVAAAVGVIIASIIVAGFVAICRLKRQKPPEPQEVRKRMRPARTDVPSMYAEDDVFDDEYQRQLDVRCSRASSTIRSSRYVSEGFVQYSQPSLNDPDLILPRGGDIEFTTLSGA